MRSLGLPSKILSIIEALHFHNVSCVRFDGDTDDCFLIKSGVCQGCIRAPDCFDVAMDWVLDRSTRRAMHGAILGQIYSQTDSDDDVALLSDLLSLLLSALGSRPRWSDCQLEENENPVSQ